ncbi:odorant receptor 4-like [Leptidea sinapis]|uniref:odorant receptor 4-like n=1 Tax=Leptidea sinapis TaxID=189913 RepID=UPI0021C3FAF3|nr:odorant receptor 4-like [Leptidea sinapis]
MKKVNSGLVYLGLKIDSRHTRREILKSRIVYIINFFWLNGDVLGAIICFINAVINLKSFEKATYIAPCFVFSTFANSRAYTLVHYNTEINSIINTLLYLEDRENKKPKSKERKDIIHRGLCFLNIVISGTKVLNIVLVMTFFVSPLVLVVVKYFKTNEWKLLLPFLITYPFDPYDIRYWPFVYIHQIWSEIIVVLSTCCTDILLYIFCTFISIQFRLLQYEIRNIFKNQCRNREEFHDVFIELVKWHQKLICVSKTLDIVYTKSTLLNFLVSSIIICLTGFNFMVFEDKMLACTFFVFLSSNLLQIFFLCYFGDMLMRSSEEVSSAIYNSEWYSKGRGIGKNFHIVHARSQKPCKLTAFRYADVNLRAFTSILSTAWSYFALLKTLYK